MIGQKLCEKLLKRGHSVVAVVRRNSDKGKNLPMSEKIEIVYKDMESYETLSESIQGRLDVAILLAWNGTRGSQRSDKEVQAMNLQYNMNAVKQVLKLGCTKVMSAGSQAEYGPWYEEEKQTEDICAKPNTEYGKYKLKFYEDASAYCRKNEVTFVEPRFFSLFGPSDYEGTLVMSLLKKMTHNEVCQMTEGKQMWDFLYIDDAIEALFFLIEKDDVEGIYNLGYGEAFPLKDFIQKMYQITNSRSELQYGSVPYPSSGMVSINPSVVKLKRLGWYPKVTFEEGIRTILNCRVDLFGR